MEVYDMKLITTHKIIEKDIPEDEFIDFIKNILEIKLSLWQIELIKKFLKEKTMEKIKMCPDKDTAIHILEFIKNDYEKQLNEDSQVGCQKYIEALQMAVNTLNVYNPWISIIEKQPDKFDYLEISKDNINYYKRLEIAYQTDTVMYDIGYYDGHKWFNERGYKIENVIAWKPFIKYTEYENERDAGYSKGYKDDINKCKDFADEIYKFFCKKKNWDDFKNQWLENGECYWLKKQINTLLKEFENRCK